MCTLALYGGACGVRMNFSFPFKASGAAPARPSLRVLYGLFFILFIVLSLFMLGWQRWDVRNQNMKVAELSSANLANAIAEHEQDSLDKAKLILDDFVAVLEMDGVSPDVKARLQEILALPIKGLPAMQNLIVLDALGQRTFATLTAPGQSPDNSDRAYFRFHRDDTSRGAHIGMPIRARSSGDRVMTVSRRINHPDGRFAGLVLTLIPLEVHHKYYAQFDIGGHGQILLQSTDQGTLLASRPFQESLPGQPGALLLRAGLSVSPLDGVKRMVGVRKMAQYPLLVAVGVAEDEVLANWRSATYRYLVALLVLLTGMGLQGWYLFQQARLRACSDQMLRSISDSLPMLINYTDTGQRYRFLNRAYQAWTGKPPEQIVGLTVAELIGPVAYENTRPQVEEALQGKASVREFRSVAYGAPRDVRVQYMPQFDRHGKVEGTVTLVTDISEYKAIQHALLRSQESLKRAQSIAHVGSWEYELASGEICWSDENYRIHGHAPLSIPLNAETVAGMIHPDDRARVSAARQQAIDGATGFRIESRRVWPDGSVREVIDHAEMVRDEHGDPVRLVGALIDVTERKQARQQLQTSEHLLRSITDSLPMLVGYITPDERYSFNNKAFERLTGTPLSQITGRKVVDVTSVHSYQACRPHVLKAMDGCRSTVDFIYESTDGPCNMRAEFLPQFDASNAMHGMVLMVTDVSEFRRIEQQLQAAAQLLHSSQKIAHVGSWEYDMGADKLVWSEETYRIFGMAPDCAAALDDAFWIRHIHPEDRARVLALRNGKLAEAAFYEQQYRIVRPDGEVRYLAHRVDTVVDADSKVRKQVGALIDITERRLAELAVAEAGQREMTIGYDIQNALLMADVPPELNGAWISTYVEPSQGLHGDFVAVSQHSPTNFNLLVGDVMGKGIHAAMIGAGIKNAYYQVLAELLAQAFETRMLPGAALIVNALHHKMTPKLIELNCFVTLALYAFDLKAGTVTVVNAGHTEGLLARAGGAQVERIAGDNLPIGVLASEVYQERVLSIADDDQLVVYSDGISEACSDSGDEFGADGIAAWLLESRDAALPAAAALQQLRLRLAGFGGGGRIVDDQTVIMIRLRPLDQPGGKPDTSAECALQGYLTLPFHLDALPALRQHIEQACTRWQRDDAEAFLLAVFEAATNAIRHTSGALSDACQVIRVSEATDMLTFEMLYPGAPVVLGERDEPDFSGATSGGFGLYIMHHLVDSVEYGVPLDGMVSVRLKKRMNAQP